jgi:hypothetical protein
VIPRLPVDRARRAERKADLLLASQLLRGQAVLAVDDIGERADVWGRRWQAVRGWLADPVVLATGSAAAAFMAGASGGQRGPLIRGVRLALLAWRAWKAFARR